MRGQPDGYNLTPGFIWGIGGAYPSRSNFRVVGEMKGEALFDQSQTFTGSNPAPGMPREWDPDATRDLFGGFQYSANSGFYFGAGVTYTASYFLHRRDFTTSEDSDFDRLGLQVRLGYHPGVEDVRAAGRHGHADRAADTGAAAEPRADGEGALRAVHG